MLLCVCVRCVVHAAKKYTRYQVTWIFVNTWYSTIVTMADFGLEGASSILEEIIHIYLFLVPNYSTHDARNLETTDNSI